MVQTLPLVVFSHLRWDFVYQRPQHLLSRMAAKRQVLVIEEPVYTPAEPHWEVAHAQARLTVYRPHTPLPDPGYADAQLEVLAALLPRIQENENLNECIAWLYTPLALPLVAPLDPALLIYDCMDELAAFAFAPPQLLEREAATLRQADLVFTGGPSLCRAKQDRHPSVHCFPSSVDAAHFQSAQRLADPADQAEMPHPRLGFFGVIDERLDLELLRAVAEAHPEWQIVLVGPVVKIDPAQLPQAANLHYLGQRQYAELPSYLSGWDACILPFAQNEATRFISPTKTLEYMAAEKPIISTPIVDVAEPYGEIVYLGATPAEFIQACEQALSATQAERDRRVAGMRAVLANTSWDRTAQAMHALIERALEAKLATAPPS
jgi:UDP-galactopyranose mutase